jgi:hypothetical protein
VVTDMPSKDLTMSVDDQMLTCLEIMAKGEDMLPIGVWEAPVKRLAMKELAVQVGNGYRITDKGRAHLAKAEGVEVAAVEALSPPRSDWIVTVLPGDPACLVVLRKNELTVSGYEAMAPARFVPIVHEQTNDIDTVAVRGDVDGFMQAMLDAAWARGLRPSDPA